MPHAPAGADVAARVAESGDAADTAEHGLAPELQRFLEHLRVERRLAGRTCEMYALALRRLQGFAADDGVALRAAQPQHLRTWAARLRSQGLGACSIAIALAAWRGLYGWWGRQQQVAANPVQGLRAPRAPRPLPKALSVEQAVGLAEQAKAESDEADDPVLAARDHAIVELLYGCGLRIGELLGLDLRAAAPRATTVGADTAAGQGWIELPPASDPTAHVLGKGRKRRSVPIGRAALTALQHWLALRERIAAAEEPALFVSRRGTRLTPNQLRNRLRTQALAAGLPTRLHPHMLRHSFASHVLQSSGDLRAVQELLGHASIASTQVYTRLDFQHLAKIYDAAHPRAKSKP
jgi:integrase/recombinase XerC